MISQDTMFVVALLSFPGIYLVSRIVFRAYFKSKLEFQESLFQRLKQEE